jgi:hypothetical protein
MISLREKRNPVSKMDQLLLCDPSRILLISIVRMHRGRGYIIRHMLREF